MLVGDHLVFDAVRDTLAAAGRPADALALRCLPTDAAVIESEVRLLLAERRTPGAILCRGRPQADAAAAAVAERGRGAGPAPVIAACEVFGPHAERCPFPHARAVLGPQEWGTRIGRMLARQARGEALDPDHEIVPVELALP